MAPVRQFYVDNLSGDVAATVAAANSAKGAVYRRRATAIPSPVTSRRVPNGTSCESDHGCKPIPVTRAMIGAPQRTDPRCQHPAPSPKDAEALRQLQNLLEPKE